MQITIKSRHLKITDEIKQYAHDKAEKLLKYYDRIQSIEVIIDQEGDHFSVQMIVNAGSSTEFIGNDQGPDTFTLIDLVEEKLERQIRKHKEKERNHLHSQRKASE